MFVWTIALAALLAGSSAASVGEQTAPMSSQEEMLAAKLRPIDQSLLNAFTTGDRVAWADVLGPGFVYIAENEQAVEASTLLSLLVPSKPGDEGADYKPFLIVDYSLRLAGDTATVIHHDAEQREHLGSKLTGMDVTTEVWQRVAGKWKLRLVHTTPIPTPPPPQILSASDAASLIGRYRAAGETVSLTAVDGGISWRVEGRPMRLLRAEARDVLFEPYNPRVRYIFQRNAAGAVVAVPRRNENRAIRYVRLP